jgi:dTDP-4-dehydrorhamnose 3,5-epimerase
MIFHELEIPGAFLLEPEGEEDARGFFSRGYCRDELEARGLDPTVVRCHVAVNRTRGTVRGLYWQAEPYPQIKLVRCTWGAVYDVILDLRAESPAYLRHYAAELSERNRLALYVPAGCAHGYQTLEEKTEVFYQMSEFDYPEHGRGARYDDPAFSIPWPLDVSEISDQDLGFPDFDPLREGEAHEN